jgi:hypothetical protein
MTTPRQKLGSWGETLAADYLTRKGYTVLERNVRTPHGEIDPVTQQRAVRVFVEVNTHHLPLTGILKAPSPPPNKPTSSPLPKPISKPTPIR